MAIIGIHTDERMFQDALKINSMDQIQDEKEKRRMIFFKPIFSKMILGLIKDPNDEPLAAYLYFTATRDNFSKEEAMRIHRELLMDLRKAIVKAKEENQINLFRNSLN